MSNEMLENVVRSRIAELVRAGGLPNAERELKMSKHTLARFIANLPVRTGSVLVAARALGISSLPIAGDLT